MPERERNSEIRRKVPEIQLKTGQTAPDLETLKQAFPDFFSGESYRQALDNEIKTLAREISATFAGYPKNEIFNKLRTLIALKTGDVDLKLMPVLDMEVNVVNGGPITKEEEQAVKPLSISEQARREATLQRRLKHADFIFASLHPFLVSIEELMALGRLLVEIHKDVQGLEQDVRVIDDHLTRSQEKLSLLENTLEVTKDSTDVRAISGLRADITRLTDLIQQTLDNRVKKEKRLQELSGSLLAISEALVLAQNHHHFSGGLDNAEFERFLARTAPVHSTVQRLESIKVALADESLHINLPARFLPLTEVKDERVFIVHDSEKEIRLLVEQEIEKRRQKFRLWAKRGFIGALLGAGALAAGLYLGEEAEKAETGLHPTHGNVKLPQLNRPSNPQPFNPRAVVRERINPDGSKTITLPAPEMDDQLNFVRRNMLGYLQHEGFLDEKLERDIRQADDFLLLEGIIMGHFTDTWLVPADNPTFHHLSLTVHPQMKRLIQVMYGREAEVKVYTDNSARENDRGAAVDVSLDKNLLCSDDYKIGLYVKSHAEANGQAHVMHSAVKNRLFCK